ncbi:MAG: branched-chain amino acid ABC transporter permease [Rhodospirillaceae bacterium]|nr:branched-chain amino acid ABC transporter permease [Rhodospirillaceae bacterium]
MPSRNVLSALAVLVLALAVVPMIGDKYWIKLATRMVVLGIFAMSLDLLVGYTGLVSFGHAAFFGLSGYVLHLVSPEDAAANMVWALPVCLGVTALAALVIVALSVRTKGVYFIMVTLAFAQMLFYFFHDSDLAGGSDGAYIYFKPILALGSVVLVDLGGSAVLFYFSLVSLIVLYAGLVMVLRAPFGKVIQGIKVNEHRMQALGFNTYLYKLVSFVIAGTIAGYAGFLFASIDGFVSPELLGWQESGIALVMVILGGMGTLFGPVIGAIALLGVEELFRDRALFGFMAAHWQILMGGFVICIVLFFANGLGGLLVKIAGRQSEER